MKEATLGKEKVGGNCSLGLPSSFASAKTSFENEISLRPHHTSEMLTWMTMFYLNQDCGESPDVAWEATYAMR